MFGVLFQAVRLINLEDPMLAWPGYVGDIGSLLQFGVGYALSRSTGDDSSAKGSAITTSFSAAFCCAGRLTAKYAPEFAAVFGVLSAECDIINAVFCEQSFFPFLQNTI